MINKLLNKLAFGSKNITNTRIRNKSSTSKKIMSISCSFTRVRDAQAVASGVSQSKISMYFVSVSEQITEIQLEF